MIAISEEEVEHVQEEKKISCIFLCHVNLLQTDQQTFGMSVYSAMVIHASSMKGSLPW